MNVIGPIFAMISVIALLYFGMGTVQDLSDQAELEINATDDMYDSLQTADNTTTAAFSIMGVAPWLFVLIAVIGGLMLLLGLVR